MLLLIILKIYLTFSLLLHQLILFMFLFTAYFFYFTITLYVDIRLHLAVGGKEQSQLTFYFNLIMYKTDDVLVTVTIILK